MSERRSYFDRRQIDSERRKDTTARKWFERALAKGVNFNTSPESYFSIGIRYAIREFREATPKEQQ